MNKHRERLYRALMNQPIDRPLTDRESAKIVRMKHRRAAKKRVHPGRVYMTVPVLDKGRLDAGFTEDFDWPITSA